MPIAALAGLPEAVARTHVGKVREINEDRFLVRSERGLWAVADGMGGHCDGGEAAGIAIAELAALADGAAPLSDRSLRAALDRADRRIRNARTGPRYVSGTTVVVAWLDGLQLSVFWAGDSRAYLLGHERERCLTRDHSLVQELLDAGEIDARQAAAHPQANVVTRALGAGEGLVLDKVVVELAIGDRVLLCSDGVSRSFGEIRANDGSISLLADRLLNEALARDGSDNATLVAIHLNGLSPECAEPTDAAARR